MSTNLSGRAIIVGALLLALGIGLYVIAAQNEPRPSVTALIPAFFGLPILILGLLAREPNRRKHMMHGAVIFGLIGALASLSRAGAWAKLLTGQGTGNSLAVGGTFVMFLICAAFVAMCVQSFRAARRAG
jgi:uncharacterized membrane protein